MVNCRFLMFLFAHIMLLGCNMDDAPRKNIDPHVLEQRLNDEDIDYISSIINYEAIMTKSFNIAGAGWLERRNMIKSYKKDKKISVALVGLPKNSGEYKLTSVRGDTIVMAVITENINNYVEFINLEGEIKDMYFYNAGDYLSNTFAELVGALEDSDPREIRETVARIRVLVESREIDLAKSLYENLPQKVKDTKVMGGVKITIASMDSTIDVVPIIDHYLNAYPDQAKYVAYLKYMNAYYMLHCNDMESRMMELWTYTGVDSSLLRFENLCYDYINSVN